MLDKIKIKRPQMGSSIVIPIQEESRFREAQWMLSTQIILMLFALFSIHCFSVKK